jgi:hypothetical protein
MFHFCSQACGMVKNVAAATRSRCGLQRIQPSNGGTRALPELRAYKNTRNKSSTYSSFQITTECCFWVTDFFATWRMLDHGIKQPQRCTGALR